MKADFHSHSTYSDGVKNIKELFDLATKANLNYYSITDHDNVDSVAEALEIQKDYDLKYLPGIELSSYYKGRTVHLLAYFKDPSLITEEFKNILADLKAKREKRANEYIASLNYHYDLGINKDDLADIKGIIARPHIANLITKKLGISKNQAFEKYLKEDNIAYIPAVKLDVLEAFNILKSVNAFVVLAHPCLIKKDYVDEILNLINVDGIEIDHPQNKDGDYEYFKALAIKNNKVISAGSDFHRFDDNRHADIGTHTLTGENLNVFLDKFFNN